MSAAFAVVDLETTGVYFYTDRIIEIGVVGLDASCQEEWRWSTLVNPHRDLGLTSMHGIVGRDVQTAPEIGDYLGYVSSLLNGRTIVGHNVNFDVGFLRGEFRRAGQEVGPDVNYLDTKQLAGEVFGLNASLTGLCDYVGVDHPGEHHALGDALATGMVFSRLWDSMGTQNQTMITQQLSNARNWPTTPVVRHEGVTRPMQKPPVFAHLQALPPPETIPTLSTIGSDHDIYLSVLRRAAEDRMIDDDEVAALDTAAHELDLTADDQRDLHKTLLREAAGAMWQDGQLSQSQQRDLVDLAAVLSLTPQDAHNAAQTPIVAEAHLDRLQPGDNVVFTGAMDRPRREWKEVCGRCGINVTGGISKRTTALVIADPCSESAKARRARELGVRIIAEHSFEGLLPDPSQ